MKHYLTIILALLFSALALAGCSIDIERNPDGSLSVESSMTEAAIQDELRLALADPLIKDIQVELHTGYIEVRGERQRPDGSQDDTLGFRLELGVDDGELTATISEATLDGKPLDPQRVATWNKKITNRLDRASQRHPNATLQTVSVTNSELRMTWRVETARSR
jgi:hypothetical protein